jgi:hypothetical protein
MSADVAPDLASFEAVWLARLRILAGETYAALMLVSALCGDKLTVRAIAHGDPAASSEIRRAFARLGDFLRRYLDEFEPAPLRFKPFAQIVARAFAALGAAATTFERSTGPAVDFDGFEIVAEQLTEAGRCMALIVQEPTAEPAKTPTSARKPRRKRAATLND